jgi:hypothetical protein
VRLPERLVALHRALDDAGLPHAFGGAIALAYCTLNPRGTSDIDVNVFIPAEEGERALGALPVGVDVPADAPEVVRRDGQIRVWWDETPLDLFFDYAPVHAEAARHRRAVPFEGERIPVLGPVELAVFKAVFDRTRDWADLEEMASAGTLDATATADALRPLLGDGDPRIERVRGLAVEG